MTRTYSAADFANARFAEHELGLLAIRSDPDDIEKPWADGGGNWHSDQAMARDGWVPVPTKPTITETEYSDYVDDLGLGELTLEEILADFGIEVIPDPEPTNTDRLEKLIISAPGNFEGVKAILKRPANVRAWAEYLNDNNVYVKDN